MALSMVNYMECEREEKQDFVCVYIYKIFFKKQKWDKTVYLAEGEKDWHGTLVSAHILHVFTAVERNGALNMCL